MDFRKAIISHQNQNAELIQSIISGIRPGRLESTRFAESRIKDLNELLKSDEECREIVKSRFIHLFRTTSSTNLLTQSGLFSTGGMFSDIIHKIKHTILPPLFDKNDLTSVVSLVFNKPWDHKWVQEVPNKVWLEILDTIGINLELVPDGHELDETLNAILILSHRIVVLGLDPVLINKVPGISNLDSPFFQQNREISSYIDKIKALQLIPTDETVEYKYILNTLESCIQKLRYVHLNRHTIGAGMGLTYLTRKLDNHVTRIRVLLRIMHDKKNSREVSIVRLFKEIVEHETTRNKLTRHLSANIGLVAFQVTEHAAKTGEHYISKDKSEYFKFFRKSLGGGFIVAILVCIKMYIYYQHLPPLIETISNGLNYGIGFLIIHFAGFTLATKQPAMTASTLAGALEGDAKDSTGISNLAQLVVKISRTQFISFAGNLLMVFPAIWLLSLLYLYLTGEHMADPEKASQMLDELHPFNSLTIWYAAVAGILLYSAGLISGYFDNKTVFSNIPERIKRHPALTWVPSKRLEKIANYMGENLGSMAGNFSLGFLLASMAFVGFILGLPLDVRHVTLVTGTFGLSLQSLNNVIPSDVFWFTITSIVLIGFMNFIVSFGLAIFTAMRARKVKFRQTWKLLNLLRAYFSTYPIDFFYPPKVERKIEIFEEGD